MEPAAASEHLGTRIRRVRKSLHLSQERFAAAIGLAQSSLSQIEGGVILPGLETIQKLHAVFHIRYDYLLEGKGPATTNAVPVAIPTAGIPLVEQHALAGYEGGWADADPAEASDFAGADLLPRVLVPGTAGGLAIRIAGTSMEPTLHSGDLVLCNPVVLEQLRDNYVYVVVTDEGALVKRVLNRSQTEQTLVLKSDNRDFTTLVLPVSHVRQLFLVRRRITSDLSGPEAIYQRINALEQALYDLKAQQDRFEHRLAG